MRGWHDREIAQRAWAGRQPESNSKYRRSGNRVADNGRTWYRDIGGIIFGILGRWVFEQEEMIAMFIGANRGLGNLGQDDLDLSAYTDQSTLTGLPIWAEVGVGVLGLLVLKQAFKGGRKITAYTRKKARTQQRRAALKAELARL